MPNRAPQRSRARAPLGALAGLLLAAGLSSCSPDPVLDDARPRVISLSPSITAILLALGAADVLVGVDRYSLQVPGAGELPSLGGLFAPDLERAIELRPTLVIAVTSAQQNAFFAQLRVRGIQVHEVQPYTLDDVLASYREIGKLVGRDAAPLIARVRGGLESLRASVAGRPSVSVALVIEREPLYVVAGGTFVDELIEAAGGDNVFGDLDKRYPQVSLELLAERAPEVLIDSSVGSLDPARMRAARAYWERFDWVGRVEFIAQGVATLPGADLAAGARLLRAKIHPGVRDVTHPQKGAGF